MDKSKKVIIFCLGIVIILLIVQNHNYNKKFELLKTQLSSLQNDLHNTSNTMYNNLANYLDTALKQSQSLIETYSISYNGVDLESKTVNIHMSFRVKQTSPNTEIQVLVSPINAPTPENNNFKAITNNGVDYTCDFSVSYLYNYNFDVYEVGENGYRKKLNSEQIAQYIKKDFDNRTVLFPHGTGINKDRVHIFFELRNNTFGQEEFRIKSVELIFLWEGKEVYRKDITYRSLIKEEDIDRYNIMVASGEIDSIDDLPYDEVFGKIQMDSNGIERGYYSVSFTHEEILGKTIDGNSYRNYNYSYYVEVTYMNGETYKIL